MVLDMALLVSTENTHWFLDLVAIMISTAGIVRTAVVAQKNGPLSSDSDQLHCLPTWTKTKFETNESKLS